MDNTYRVKRMLRFSLTHSFLCVTNSELIMRKRVRKKPFIDEMTRYNYELKKPKRDGLSTEKIKKPFPIGNTAESPTEFYTEQKNFL